MEFCTGTHLVDHLSACEEYHAQPPDYSMESLIAEFRVKAVLQREQFSS